MKFLTYEPNQAWLLPPSVNDVLGEDHLCFFVHRVVERLDLRRFEEEYGEEGRRAYAPALMVKVWLYAYALQVTSSRRLEQRIREDLAFRYLAGGATPDNWTLNDFRTRHGGALNDLFVQVVEVARGLGMARLGHVAIDSTRVRANASRHRIESVEELRQRLQKTRAEIGRWQRQCDAADPNEEPGTELPAGSQARLEEQLRETQQKLAQLEKLGARQIARTDPESRFLREAGGFVLGYTADLAVSDDHLIVAQRTTQAVSDSESLLPLADQVKQNCRAAPEEVSADSGFFSVANLEALASRGIEGFVPDAHLTGELRQHRRPLKCAGDSPEHARMRARLRSAAGQARYRRRQALVEPVFGVLKEQRGMRRFRLRGLKKVAVEWALACTAFNLTRMWQRAAVR
ncbi:MAG TPA: IS1182 family transposase [Terracidiphilus sp.]|nr:IS1182 family transposase [Terracidiphilus sp.]